MQRTRGSPEGVSRANMWACPTIFPLTLLYERNYSKFMSRKGLQWIELTKSFRCQKVSVTKPMADTIDENHTEGRNPPSDNLLKFDKFSNASYFSHTAIPVFEFISKFKFN